MSAAALAPGVWLSLDGAMMLTRIAFESAKDRRRTPRCWPVAVVTIALVLLGLAVPVQSQPADDSGLPVSDLLYFSAPDASVVQDALETSRTAAPIVLPDSRRVLVITRTQTRPQVCRWFRVLAAEDQSIGQGCRVGDGEWTLLPADPAETPPATENALRLAAQPNSAVLWVGRDMVLVPLPARRPGSAPPVAPAEAEAPQVREDPGPRPPSLPPSLRYAASPDAGGGTAPQGDRPADGSDVAASDANAAPVTAAPDGPSIDIPLPTRRPEQVVASPLSGVPLPTRRPPSLPPLDAVPIPPLRP